MFRHFAVLILVLLGLVFPIRAKATDAVIENRFAHEFSIGFLKVSRDGRWIAACEKTNATMYLRVFDSITGELKWARGNSASFAFHPDSTKILTDSLYDIDTGQLLPYWQSFPFNPYMGFEFDPQGQFIIGDSLKIINSSTFETMDQFMFWGTTAQGQVMVDRTGKYILAPQRITSGNKYRFYRGFDPDFFGDNFPELLNNLSSTPCVPHPSEDAFVQSANSLRKFALPGMTVLWDVSQGSNFGCTFTEGGNRVFNITSGAYHWRNNSDGQLSFSTPAPAALQQTSVCDSPLLNSVVIGRTNLPVYSNISHSQVTTLAPHSKQLNYFAGNPLTRRAYQVASGTTVQELEFDSRQLLRLFTIPGSSSNTVIEWLAVSPNQSLYLIARTIVPFSKKVYRIDLANGSVSTSTQQIQGSNLTPSRTGQFLVSTVSGNIELIDSVTLNAIATIVAPLSFNNVETIDFVNDDTRMYISQSGAVASYALPSLSQLWVNQSLSNTVRSVATSLDGTRLAVGLNQNHVKVLDSSSGVAIGEITTSATTSKIKRLPGGLGVWSLGRTMEPLDLFTQVSGKPLMLPDEIGPIGDIHPWTNTSVMVPWNVGIYEIRLVP